jgi:hypothetical protein
MRFDTVICLDDLLRDSYWPAKAFIYDLLRVPVFKAAGLHIGSSPRHGQASNLRPGFAATRFARLAGAGAGDTDWARTYHCLPEPAAAYLSAHLPDRALVLGYEMTPALQRVLDDHGTAWLDIRLSPLRFASDLYLALRSNRAELDLAIHRHAVQPMEVMAEASLLAARLRYRRRYEPRDATLQGLCVYIGQTEHDASLLDASGRFVRAADHADTLRQLAAQGPLHYKPHPLGGEFAVAERQTLARLIGRDLPTCGIDTYELLCAEEDVSLVGISSGALQEAAWFGRRSFTLMPPLCQPRFDAGLEQPGHLQVASHVFMSEPLWADVLDAPAGDAPMLQLPPQANRLRELHNTWWGYSTAMLRHNAFQREAFELSGGKAQAEALARTESELRRTRAELDELKREFAQWRRSVADGAAQLPSTAPVHLPRQPLPRMAGA